MIDSYEELEIKNFPLVSVYTFFLLKGSIRMLQTSACLFPVMSEKYERKIKKRRRESI